MTSQTMPHAIDLLQLVGVLRQRKNSSILALEDEGREGAIYFSAGEIVHAAYDGKRAEHALHELLSWRTGDLRLAPMTATPERSLDADMASIILAQSLGTQGSETAPSS